MKNNTIIQRLFIALWLVPTLSLAAHEVRLKDIVSVAGIRDNHLIGYGLVVGLKGTGDEVKNSPYSKETIISMLERLGVNVRDQAGQIKSKNLAAVMITADLPPFARQGTRIDVTVSAIGDARDLLGGTLLVTPLLGADGEVYAVAQGSLATSAFEAQGASGSSISKGVPTSGRITNGAIIEKEIEFEFKDIYSLNLSLHNPDFTTAKRIADRINKFSKAQTAKALDPATVHLTIPVEYRQNPLEYITQIEQLKIIPDQIAKVVIDEQNGIIVMGEHVRISTVAISHGNLTIQITEEAYVSQPNPFPNLGTTEVVQRSTISVNEEADKKLMVMESGVTLQELVNGLNALGVKPRDMITILQNIKASGALQAELEIK
jgi:flagellar P-ring protein precursor FlgI